MTSPDSSEATIAVQISASELVEVSKVPLLSKNRSVWVFPLLLVIAMVVLTSLSISGTSIGAIGGNSPSDSNNASLLAGTPRSIRSDEWNVITPLIVEQGRVGFSSSLKVGLGQHDLNVIGDVPTTNWSTIFRPWNIPSLFLNSSQGFAIRWWLLSLLLITASYALVFEFSRRIDLAIFISLGIWLSPFFQWWYAPGTLAVVGTAFFAFFFFVRTLRSRGLPLLVYTLLTVWAGVAFVIVLYPPFQIPVGIILIFLAIAELGYLVQSRSIRKIRLLVTVTGIAVLTFLILGAWYLENQTTISAINGTVYPGHRLSPGGDAVLSNVLSAPFGLQLSLHGALGLVTINQSEISSFLILGPFVLIGLIFVKLNQLDLRSRWILGMLSISLAIFILWMFVGLPSSLAKLLLLSSSPGPRVVIGLGLTGFLMTAVFCAALANSTQTLPKHRKRSWHLPIELRITAGGFICGVISFAIYAWAGQQIRSGNPNLGLSPIELVALSLLAALTTSFLISARIRSGGVLLVVFSLLAGITVNPLYRGLEPLSQSKIINNLKTLASQQSDASKQVWVSLGGQYVTVLLTASGLPTLNAVQLYPDHNFWNSYLPGSTDDSIWNRYAQPLFSLGPEGSKNSVSLLQADLIKLTFDPCGHQAREFRIGFYLSSSPLNASCLSNKGSEEYQGATVYIYSRN